MRRADLVASLTIFALGAACLIARDIDAHGALPVLAGYFGLVIGGGWFACLVATHAEPAPPRNIRKSIYLTPIRRKQIK
jgi:hypothetical protein